MIMFSMCRYCQVNVLSLIIEHMCNYGSIMLNKPLQKRVICIRMSEYKLKRGFNRNIQLITLYCLPVIVIILLIYQIQLSYSIFDAVTLRQPVVISENKLILVKAGGEWWITPWFKSAFSEITDGKCPESRCEFTYNPAHLHMADAVLVGLGHMVEVPEVRPISLRHQIWIMSFYESSPKLDKYGSFNYTERFPDIFNWTMTFRRDSDVVLKFGETKRRRQVLSDQEVTSIFPSWEGKQTFTEYVHNKELGNMDEIAPIVWFNSHCNSTSQREKYVAEMEKHIGIHIYGRCGPRKCESKRRLTNEVKVKDEPCFIMTNKNYAFIIAFENGLCKDYASEKVFNGLMHNAIPLVLAGNLDLDIFPPHSVIYLADFSGPKELTDYLYYLMRNETAYMEYFDWRKRYFVKGYDSRPTPCDLCLQLHNRTKYFKETKQSNLDQWLFEDSECFLPDLSEGLDSTLKVLDEHIKVPEDIILSHWLINSRLQL